MRKKGREEIEGKMTAESGNLFCFPVFKLLARVARFFQMEFELRIELKQAKKSPG